MYTIHTFEFFVIRFELPFNIWCGGCGSHAGMGVRYNADKSKVGQYYSTPIFKFRMKCHLCDNHFEITTDPKVIVNINFYIAFNIQIFFIKHCCG